MQRINEYMLLPNRGMKLNVNTILYMKNIDIEKYKEIVLFMSMTRNRPYNIANITRRILER